MKLVLAFIITTLALCCGGCSTARSHYYIGQGLDVATTYYALEVDGDFVEGNELLGDIEGVIIGKVICAGVTEGLAYLVPESADTIYKIGAVFGYGAGAWNVYQIGTH